MLVRCVVAFIVSKRRRTLRRRARALRATAPVAPSAPASPPTDTRYACLQPALAVPAAEDCAAGRPYPRCRWQLPDPVELGVPYYRVWRNTTPEHRWARPGLVSLVLAAAREYGQRWPGEPVIVGDLESEQAALTAAYSSEKSAAAIEAWLIANCAVDIGPVFTIVPQGPVTIPVAPADTSTASTAGP